MWCQIIDGHVFGHVAETGWFAMLSQEEKLRAKAITRFSVRDCGGQEAAAASVGRIQRHQSMSDFGNVGLMEKFVGIDVAGELDRFSGVPHFAGLLAEWADCLLIPRPKAGNYSAKLDRVTGDAMREIGDVFSKLGASLDDGKISEKEKSSIHKEIDEALAALSALHMAVGVESESGEE